MPYYKKAMRLMFARIDKKTESISDYYEVFETAEKKNNEKNQELLMILKRF